MIIKKISLQELFPTWNTMKKGEILTVEVINIQRPEQYLDIQNSLNKNIAFHLEKCPDKTYLFSITDGLRTITSYTLDNTLTKEIVYDKNGNAITIDNDHCYEGAEEAYDYFFG